MTESPTELLPSQDRILDTFSHHLLIVEAVPVGDHDPLSCPDCVRACEQLIRFDPAVLAGF